MATRYFLQFHSNTPLGWYDVLELADKASVDIARQTIRGKGLRRGERIVERPA